MNLSDVLGLGKVLPIDKLIDVVASVTGRLSKSYFDKKDVDTKAYEIKKLAEARAEEIKIISKAVRDNFLLTGGIDYKETAIAISSPKQPQEKLPESSKVELLTSPPLAERTKERKNFQESKKQLNIESVTAYAAEQLKNEPPVSDEPLDEDWKNRFFTIAEDISSDEMQALWGRILAGEIKQPKSYSMRTLELLRNLNKKEAECFMKFGQMAITSSNISFILNFKGEKLLEEKYNLTFSERLLLEELGLLTANDLQFEIRANPEKDGQAGLRLGNVWVVVSRRKGTPQQNLPALVFTKIGQELLQLIESTPQLDYIQLLAAKLRREGVTIKYANILKVDNDQISHTPLIDVPLTDTESKQEEEKRKQETTKAGN